MRSVVAKKVSAKAAKMVGSKLGSVAGPKFPKRLDLDADLLPEIKGWQVGKTYSVVLQVKMVSHRMDDPYDGEKGEMSAGFSVLSASSGETK
jgi:hypothetical protein